MQALSSRTMHMARGLAHARTLRTPKHFATALRPSLRRRPVGAHAASTSAAAAATAGAAGRQRPTWSIRMLYDGECALCMKEVDFLKGRDEGKGRIDFVDIAAPGFDPADNAGITFDQAMERIHAILPDGRVVRDVEVFRLLYEAVGLGWVYAVTKYEPVERAANAVYGVWAKYRTQITGREALERILEKRRLQRAGEDATASCRAEGTECEVPVRSGGGSGGGGGRA